MKIYVAVGLGGIFGSLLRYGITIIFTHIEYTNFPLATLIVNMSGAFLLTFLLYHPRIRVKLDETILIGLTTGLIGSYTTFSAITVEIVTLASENIGLAILYAGITIILGLWSSLLGFKAAKAGAST